MPEINALVAAFSRLDIDSIPNDWINAVIEADFADSGGVQDDDFDNQLRDNGFYAKALKQLAETLRPWLAERQEDEQGLWSVLVENDIAHKSVLCLLAHLMEGAQKRAASGEQLCGSLEAANVYLTLVMVPGSGAFKLFHPLLFEKAMNCFKLWKSLNTGKRKRLSSDFGGSQSSQGSQSGRGKKRGRQSQQNQDEPEEDDDDEDGMLTSQDITKINKKLFNLLKSFVEMLERYSLNQADEAVYSSVQVLANLSKLEAETFMGQFADNPDVSRMLTVPELCFHGLGLLCSEAHGDVTTMTKNVLKALMPSLLMLIGEGKATAATSIPRHLKLIRDHALNFICHLMKSGREGIFGSVRILLQHLCTKVTDRAEYRTNVAEAVVVLMRALPASHYAKFIQWIYKLSRTPKMSSRVFALDLACMLISEKERDDVPEDAEEAVFTTHTFIIHMLLSRCSDVAPTVRARAIAGFASCVSSSQPHVTEAVQNMMTPSLTGTAARPAITRIVPTPDAQRTANKRPDNTTDCHMSPEASTATVAMETMTSSTSTIRERGLSRNSLESAIADLHTRPRDSPFVTVQLTPGVEITLTDGKGVVSMLRRRVRDEKVNVRKAALHALENLIRLDKQHINDKDVEMIADSCRDPSLLVRKQAMSSLTDLLLDIPLHPALQQMFLRGMLPMVLDRESTASEKCVNTCAEVFLDNIVPLARSTTEHQQMVWDLCAIIAGNDGGELRRYLAKCCVQWKKAGRFNDRLINALKTHIGSEHNQGAWMMLAEITAFYSKINTDFVLDYWTDEARNLTEDNYSVVQEVLTVLGHVSKHVNKDRISDITADLKVRLMQFNLPPVLISVSVNTLSKLCEALTGDATSANTMTKQWFVDLLNASDAFLSAIILNENPEATLDEDKIICHLFTLGEIAQLCPDKTPKRVFLLIQSLISTPVSTSIDGSSQSQNANQNSSDSQPQSQTDSQSNSQTGSQSRDGAPLVTPDVSSINKNQSSELPCGIAMTSSQGSQCIEGLSQGLSQWSQTGVLSQFRGSKMAPKIRAYAFITLGKLCLQHESIAKKCVAAMARELECCPDPVVRNNVVIIMCDLCIRYTQLVDSYVGRISACLRDECALIRKQTLNLLTHLLQEDYIKWKDALFFRFALSLVDDVQEIRDFGEFCMVHLLTQRHPGMFYQHFVECIFHFNNYSDHPVFNKFPQTEKEKKMFSLKGQANAKKRQRIYRFLLSKMTDEQKFQLCGKLCHDVLGAVVDDVIKYDVDSAAILRDTLQILCCKEIKLASLKAKPTDDAETELEMAQAVMNEARKKVITQVVKTNVIENIVPTVISLKHLLEKNRSEVTHDLMLYLRELMKDYKNEVQDILSADRQLASEIEFDIRKFEEREQAEKEAELARQTQTTPIPGIGPPRQMTPQRPGITGTPRTPRTPRDSPRVGSPRVSSPGIPTTPGIPRTPKTPANVRAVPVTPSRDVSLSTLAVLNSARKVLAKGAQTPRGTPNHGAVRATPNRSLCNHSRVSATGKTPQAGQKKVAFSKSVDERDPQAETPQPQPAVLQTPRNEGQKTHGNLTRAMSTPSANLTFSNITFMDPNASMIPPSPIPTDMDPGFGHASQVAGCAHWTKQTTVDPLTRVVKQCHVLHMESPDRPAPKPRVWNISSPRQRLSSRNKENNDSVFQPDNQADSQSNNPGGYDKTSSKTGASTKNVENTANISTNIETSQSEKSKAKPSEKPKSKSKAKPLEEINTSTRTRRSSRNMSKNTSLAATDLSLNSTMDTSEAVENSSVTGSRRRSQRSRKQ